jgi:hypothetical protein
MGCCGSARLLPTVAASRRGDRPLPSPSAPTPPPPLPVRFTYTGPTRLQAVGPVSGRRYRFDQPGSEVEVDARDVPAFAAIPHLRRVKATP